MISDEGADKDAQAHNMHNTLKDNLLKKTQGLVDLGAKISGVNTQGAQGNFHETQKQKEIESLKEQIKKLQAREKEMKIHHEADKAKIIKYTEENKKLKVDIDKLRFDKQRL